VAARRRTPIDVLMIGWLALVIDFSSFGLVQHVLPATWLKYDYPFSIAWHGPIIPYLFLGGTALLWLIDRVGRARAEKWLINASLPIFTAIAEHKVTHLCGAPVVLNMMVHAPDAAKRRFDHVVDVATGGAAPPDGEGGVWPS